MSYTFRNDWTVDVHDQAFSVHRHLHTIKLWQTYTNLYRCNTSFDLLW